MTNTNSKRARSFATKGNAIVIGLGKGGVACAEYLLDEGWTVEVADVSLRPQLVSAMTDALPGIRIHSPIYPETFRHADLVVLASTSKPSNFRVAKIAQDCGCKVLNSLELFFEHRVAPVVAVTGTNGKSTVTTLLKNVMERQGGLIRVAGCRGEHFMELLSRSQPDAYLLELSALHLEQVCSINPDLATVLNVSPDHLEHYETVDKYVESMSKTISNAKTVVVNRDDPIVAAIPVKGNRICIGLGEPDEESDYGVIQSKSKIWAVRGQSRLFDLSQCAITGNHNIANLLAVCALADSAGYPVDSVTSVLTQFKGLPYRCWDEGEWNGVRWVNDARSTNVGAVLAAIQLSTGPVVLIAGGFNRGTDFSQLEQRINGQLRACVLFGRDRKTIGNSFKETAIKHQVDDIYDAVKIADEMTEEGDCVIFSPGCAGNDQFADYEHRGKTFSHALQMHIT